MIDIYKTRKNINNAFYNFDGEYLIRYKTNTPLKNFTSTSTLNVVHSWIK